MFDIFVFLFVFWGLFVVVCRSALRAMLVLFVFFCGLVRLFGSVFFVPRRFEHYLLLFMLRGFSLSFGPFVVLVGLFFVTRRSEILLLCLPSFYNLHAV